MTTNDTTNDTTAANTAAEPGTSTPPRGLAARAITAARRYRATDPAGYHNRHTDPRWARRAATAREVAVALAVPVDVVTVTDDPACWAHARPAASRYRMRVGLDPTSDTYEGAFAALGFPHDLARRPPRDV